MKVFLINPPSYDQRDRLIREGRCMQRESSWSNLWNPITLCVLKPWLQKHGFDCKLIEATARRYDMKRLRQEVKKFSPDVAIINTAVPSIIKEDLDTAKMIKQINPDIFTIMIGVPPTIMADVIFNDRRGKHVDACIRHEPEIPVLRLLSNLKHRVNWKKTRGISFKINKKVIHNPSSPPIDLNKLPNADFSDLPLDEYTLPFSRERILMIETSRGCPYNCTFCVGKVYNSNCFRFRDPVKIVDEIEEIIAKYRVKSFLFWADTWMLGLKKAAETCNEIVKRNLDIKFLANARVDCAPLWLLKKMKRAGCEVLAYGVESCVQEILNNINKKTTVVQIKDAIRNANKSGIPNSAHVIVGLPGETWNTVKLTTKRLIEFNPTYINVYCPVPYPGTALFEMAKQRGWIETFDWSMYEELHAVMRNEAMTTEDILRARKYIVNKFYFRPKLIGREIKKALNRRSPKGFYYHLYDSFRFLRGWAYGGKSSESK